jgi:hypothetical protein
MVLVQSAPTAPRALGAWCVVHETRVIDMAEIFDGEPSKRRGRPPGAPNKITRDIRAALRDLAEGNADRVQSWLDSVADTDPAEALRLWLALLRYVTPTLQAAAVADLTPKSTHARLASMATEELWKVIVQSPEAADLVKQGVKTRRELLRGIACGPRVKALVARQAPQPSTEPNPVIPDDEELLR